MDSRFNESELKFLLELKEKTIRSCKNCGGEGWLENRESKEFKPCCCRKIFIFLKELVYASIPEEFWMNEYKKLEITPNTTKILIGKYIKNIDKAKEKGMGICLLGPNGVGKTSLLSEIGKYCILKHYSIIYLTAQDYVNYKMENNLEIIERIEKNSQVLLLDELDKPYKKKGSDYVPAMIENLLRNILPRRHIVCMGSNWTKDEIREYFGDSVYSIIQRKIRFLSLTGKDKSEGLQDSWENRLYESNLNYLSKYLVDLTEEM